MGGNQAAIDACQTAAVTCSSPTALFSDCFPGRNRGLVGVVRCADGRGLHAMRYLEWGDRPIRACWSACTGLTRNGRDFDALARHWPCAIASFARMLSGADGRLARRPGRLRFPAVRFRHDGVCWPASTSSGALARHFDGRVDRHDPRQPEGTRRSVALLNDVGPVITAESLKRIGDYVGKAPAFASIDEADRYIGRSAPRLDRLPTCNGDS